MKKLKFLIAFFILLNFVANGANFVEVSCISNKIIQLKFVDGIFNFHDLNQSRDDDRVILYPGGRLLNSEITNLGNYTIGSATDPNYVGVVNPIDMGLNMRIEQNWDLDLNGRPTHVEETYVYLFLTNALSSNATYTITVNASSVNIAANSLNITYNNTLNRSESVHVNNLGYSQKAESKFAYVYAWLGDHDYLKLENDSFITQKSMGHLRNFYVLDYVTKAVVYTDSVRFRRSFNNPEFGQWGTNNNNFLGADVYECNFSSFNTPGEYVISVEGIGTSFPFKIDADFLREPLFYTLKNLYENRSGIALNTPYAQYNRPICHKPGVNGFNLYYSKVDHYDLGPASADANAADTTIINAQITGLVNSYGWYQDAGDWDAYWTHSKVPANLLHLYETAPAVFDTMNLQLENESANNLPDLLDEARWLLRFYKRSKDDINNPTLQGTGGVPGARIFGDIFATTSGTDPENGKGSWQDNDRKWVMLGEGPHLTFIYAGLAAHYARLLIDNNLTDPESINWATEAEDAWNWAIANTDSLDIVPSNDYNLTKLRIFAAGSLYRLTGNKIKYESQFIYDIDHLPNENSNLSNIGQSWYQPWNPLAPIWESIPTDFISNDDYISLGCINYYKATLLHTNYDAATKTRIYNTLKTGTDFLLGSFAFPSTLQNRACRWGGNWWLPMGIGQGTSPYLNFATITTPLFLPTADSVQAKDWLKNMFTTADYFLGTNPLNMTMISGIGEKNIHQIFHMDSWYCNNGNNTNMKKGFISYGAMKFEGDDLGGFGGFPGPYKYYYGLNKSYPSPSNRPGHERFMPSRTSPLANENTIHQTCINGIMTYGFLHTINVTNNPLITTIPLTNTSENSSGLLVFPNPSNTVIKFKYDQKINTASIYSIDGKNVKKYLVDATQTIDVKDLAEGIYAIKCETASKKIIDAKFVKAK